MASADWAALTGILSTVDVARGVTSGPAKPVGGGTFIYGFNSLTNTDGAVALHTAQVNFAPMAKGGDIRGALKRAPSGGLTGWSIFLFCSAQGTSINDNAYLLGLSDGDPCHIELRKGPLLNGLPDEAVLSTFKILRKSIEVVAVDVWMHLRLEVVKNDNNDVILNVYKNTGNVTTPSWVAVAGMDPFVDDALGVASGTVPYTSGYAGFGFQTSEVTRRGYVDHIEVARQL